MSQNVAICQYTPFLNIGCSEAYNIELDILYLIH